MGKREAIKTSIEEIVDYWKRHEDECGLSVDWAEAHERCWRCGCEKNLERCHIIPDSLGGKDEPSNLVLLCKSVMQTDQMLRTRRLCGIGLGHMVFRSMIPFGR